MVSKTDALFSQLSKERVSKKKYDTVLKATEIRNRCFKEQLDFLDDKCKRKTLICGRRGGKTFVAVANMCIVALNKPHANIIFITLTKGRARELVWDNWMTGLKFFDHEFDLGIKFHNTQYHATFPNGSRVFITGAENYQEAEKLRGNGHHLAMIDEVASFPPHHITYVVDSCLEPTMKDFGGTIVLLGTPGHILDGAFYEASRIDSPARDSEEGKSKWSLRYSERPRFKGSFYWSSHHWTAEHNTSNPDIWKNILEEKRLKGWSDDNRVWRREYLAEWFNDKTHNVYQYSEEINAWAPGPITEASPHGLPQPPTEEGWTHNWKFIMGIDFGDRDSTAFVVAAFADTCDTLYFIEDYKCPKLNYSRISDKINQFKNKYGEFEVIVGDYQAAATIRSLNEVHGQSVTIDDKSHKLENIDFFNSELVDGRIKVNLMCSDGYPMALISEWAALTWDESGLKEDPNRENHAADAALYAFRKSRHFWGKHFIRDPKPGEEGYEAFRNNKEANAHIEYMKKKESLDWIDYYSKDCDPVEL